MRIKLSGNPDSAENLAALLRENGITVSSESGLYEVVFSTTDEKFIILDSIDCRLDAKVREVVAKIIDQPIILDRPGPTRSERKIVISIPSHFTDPQREKVEIGVLSALLQLRDEVLPTPTRPDPPVQPAHNLPPVQDQPRITPWYKFW